MRIVDALIAELTQEAQTTRRVLERVPDDKLSWKPHPKSMSLGQLAQHVATTPAIAVSMVMKEAFDLADIHEQPAAEKASDLLPALDQAIAQAKSVLNDLDD